MNESGGAAAEAYEQAGRLAAVAVRGYSTVLVVSDEPVEAAYAAIGVANAESAHRRVVIGDLAGEVAPIQALVGAADPHGIYDSFMFGTSLERVIYSVAGNDNLNVLPSGTESAAIAEIIGSPRWRRIASEFAATDALLLLVAASDAPGLDKLSSQLDGILVVGNPRLDVNPNAVLLARIPHPAPAPAPKKIALPVEQPLPRWRGVALAGGALLLLIAAVAILRPGSISRLGLSRASDTIVIPDSQAHDSTAVPQREVIVPANPQDSSLAATFAVEILNANTAESANFELQRHGEMMPAATISLVPIGDTEAIWYKVFAGAVSDSAQAERLLRSLRRRRIVADSIGRVVRVPLALRVDSVPSQAAVLSKSREMVKAYTAKGVPAYAMLQNDGSARIYAGAFQTPEQSSLSATALRVAGATPVLEFRTGRVQ
ncbi:MAG TPA: hypothetical protein VES88_14420 [Gemmatimonadaceae bacterium]|nr:hypothetical protein [Gemmatimonadaceae bacterium]